jgi:hypothetical protein
MQLTKNFFPLKRSEALGLIYILLLMSNMIIATARNTSSHRHMKRGLNANSQNLQSTCARYDRKPVPSGKTLIPYADTKLGKFASGLIVGILDSDDSIFRCLPEKYFEEVDIEDSNNTIPTAFGQLPSKLETVKNAIQTGISMMCSVDDFIETISEFYTTIVDTVKTFVAKKKIFLEGKSDRRNRSKGLDEIKTWFSDKHEELNKWSTKQIDETKAKIDRIKSQITNKSNTCSTNPGIIIPAGNTQSCHPASTVISSLQGFWTKFENLLKNMKTFLQDPLVQQAICYVNCVYGLGGQLLTIGNIVDGLSLIVVNFVANFSAVTLIIKFVWKIICNLTTFFEIVQEAKNAVTDTDIKQRYFHFGKALGLILKIAVTFAFKKK